MSGGMADPGIVERVFRPACDVWVSADATEIVADLPGVEPGGLHLTLEDNELLLEAEASEPEGEGPVEPGLPRRYRRLFNLAESVDRDRVRARLTDGVLRITLPRPEWVRPRRISVETD